MEKNKELDLVSVIVPVYNVEDYLDECMESIVNQTYTNIEILLIVEEASTDGSTEKCRKWCVKDNRIIYITAKIRGLGPARNQGIREARGKYIVFVDSDDWIREDYIEKLYTAICANNADMAECDFTRIRSAVDEKSICKSSGVLGKAFSKQYRWTLGQTSMWRIMTKRELWVKYNITQPNTVAEDIVTYPLLLVYADKIVGVSECLYYYRKDRKGNLCGTADTYIKTIRIMDNIVQNFIDRGIYTAYREELKWYLRKWISRMLSPLLGRIEEKEYLKTRENSFGIYERCFEGEVTPSEFLWGGFNLTRIINKLELIEDPYGRFQFSSMIAVMSDGSIKKEVIHKNVYRKYMLGREFSRAFPALLRECKPQFFFFDLLEERHDIIETKTGFYTKSDAYDEANVPIENYRVISRDSEECTELWKKSSRLFMDCLLEVMTAERIFMVENYLSEQHGDGKTLSDFSNIEEIRRQNKILAGYYAYLKDKYPNIHCIRAYEVEQYYTDDEYEYGCYPWHLNEWANLRIAGKIQEECN